MATKINAALDAQLQAHIAAGLYHGASLSLYAQGRWSRYFYGTLDGQTPTGPGLVYDLASVSKVVGVGTVINRLFAAGCLQLETPLVTYLPDFKEATVTLGQLVTHTSGLDPFIPNRDQLDAEGLQTAMMQLKLTDDKGFKYTDVNFILLGLMLEAYFGQDLDVILAEHVFSPLGLTETQFGPVKQAVPTVRGLPGGVVHDPKARVLGPHCGSAGLFSTLTDLERFLEYHLQADWAAHLLHNYASGDKPRSICWDLNGDWLSHTGYTGPYIAFNPKTQSAAIFLTNRTYEKDDRALWIEKRKELIAAIEESLSVSEGDLKGGGRMKRG